MSFDPGVTPDMLSEHYPEKPAPLAGRKGLFGTLSTAALRKIRRAQRLAAKADDLALRHPRPDPAP